MMLSWTRSAVVAAILLAVWLMSKVVNALFLSPLRKIPGPFLARLTPLWLRSIDMSGTRTKTLHKLHERYGPTVVVGPNEVTVNDISNIKELYGQLTTFTKAPVYESMTMEPHGIFGLRDRVAHGQRRKLLSHAFSQSNLQECEPLIQKQLDKMLAAVQDSVGTPIDVFKWFRLAAFDVVGELFLGQSFGGLDTGKTPQFLDDVELRGKLADLQWNNPWIAAFLAYVPLPSIRYFVSTMQRLADHGADAFRQYIEQYGRDSGRRDLLTKILSAKPDTGVRPLTDLEVSLEIGNLVFAGTDTTSTTLTFLFWELSRRPDWQKQLRDEIRSHTDHHLCFQQIQDLPVLDAVISEALRLHPAAPASLPREAPVGGRVLNGYFVPEKTVVSMQCYSTQRDPTAYPEPDIFRPERWMPLNTVTFEMKELFMPFSKGTRACLGKNLAMMELKLITAQLARRYEWKPAPATTEETMATKDYFLLIPVGDRCDLIFTET